MSARHSSIIELNGHRFDAQSGKPLDGVIAPKPAMSDVIKPKRTPTRASTNSKQVHKGPLKGKTLMRSAVKRPDISAAIPDAPKVSTRATPLEGPRTAFHSHNEDIRIKRAHQVKQSSLISRFGDIMNTPVRMPVLGASANGDKKRLIHQMDVVAAPKHHAATPQALSHPVKKSAGNSLAEKGLRAASSHTENKAKKQRLHHRIGRRLGLKPRAAGIGAGSLALLLLGGFVAYQNVPNLAVRYASMKAGVNASLPGYQPAGFAINDRVQYSPGEVAVAYKANADDRNYTLTQKNSAWNNESLKDYLTTTSGQEPQSFPENGKTIYLYGDSDATWVDGGVLYKISGDSSLNTDQLIKIASSL